MQISEVYLFTNSLPETKRFYVEKFGFKVIKQMDELLCFEVGISKIWFHQSETVEKPIFILLSIFRKISWKMVWNGC